MRMAQFLMAKLEDIIATCALEEFSTLQTSAMLALKASMECSSGLLSSQVAVTNQFLRLQPDLDLLASSLSTASTILERLGTKSDLYQGVVSTIFTVLVRIIVHGKKTMMLLLNSRGKHRLGRSECHALVMLRARYIAVVSSEVASMLSYQSNRYLRDGTIEESYLIKNLMQLHQPLSGFDMEVSPLVQLAESLSWFWEFVHSAEAIESSSASRYAAITNTIHKHSAKYLVVPIAGAITALCGSVGHGPSSTASVSFLKLTEGRSNTHEDVFSLSDYFDSDESARDWMSEDEADSARATSRRSVLQTLSRTVQCIGLVFSNHEDSELSVQHCCTISPIKEGFFLPLIVARVLSSISDHVLTEFCEKKEHRCRKKAIWDEVYPFGFRSAGAQLDLLLHRAYRCLHGINVSSPHLMNQVGKDAVYPPPSTLPPQNLQYFLPESTKAAIQIYRCVKRAYSNVRRSIPLEALDCISSALPKVKESEKVLAVKKFLFAGSNEVPFSISEETPASIMSNSESADPIPPDFPAWLLEDATDAGGGEENTAPQITSALQDDIQIVLRGICEYLAEGSLPRIGSNSESSGIQYSGADRSLQERKLAAEAEVASHKKLCSIINAFHYDPSDEKKWYRAGLCIGVKLNLILDRLIPAEQRFESDQFCLSRVASLDERDKQWLKDRGYPRDAAKMLKDQRRSYRKLSSRRSGALGTNLSIYMEHQFCNPESLQALESSLVNSCQIQSNTAAEQALSTKDKAYLSSLRSKFQQGDYSQWQYHWGASFVSALRLMRHRCFRIAMHLSKKKEIYTKQESIYSAVAEASGTAYYDAIGFSARQQTKFETRKTAQMANECFQSALESLRSSVSDSGDVPATWELLFMIGKVRMQSLLPYVC